VVTNRILLILTTISAIFFLPVQAVTTLLGGCLVTLTFGILLIPLSLIRVMFFGALLTLSYLGNKMTWLRELFGLIGLPIAWIGSIYVSLVPSMGELESRAWKLLFCHVWPYSFDFWRLTHGKISLDSEPAERLAVVFRRVVPAKDELTWRVISRVANREALDPGV
jgi:hypothetical protein